MTQIQSNRMIADKDRESREQIAAGDRASREGVANQDRRSRERISAKDRHLTAKTKARELSLAESLRPFQQAESLTRSISNASKAVGDIGKTAALLGAATNDWAWYFSSAQRMSDVGSLPLFTPYGSRFSFGNISAEAEGAGPGGVMAIQTAHTIGRASTATSGVQRAAESLFDFVNARTGRNSNYEAPDLLYVSLAFASLEAFSQNLKRAYRAASYTSPVNEYTPRVLVEMMGVSYDDLIAHKIELRDLINYIEDMKFKYLAVPDLPIAKRWAWEYMHVFADSYNSEAQQFYMFIPKHFYKLHIGEATPTWLEPVAWNLNSSGQVIPSKAVTVRTVDQIKTFAENLLAGFTNMQDAKNMKADLINAYGESAKYTKQYISVDEQFDVTVDPLTLLQFQNATILNAPRKGRASGYSTETDFSASYKMDQSNGVIQSNPKFVLPEKGNAGYDPILPYPRANRRPILVHDVGTYSISQRDIISIEATRLMQVAIPGVLNQEDCLELKGPAASICDAIYVTVPSTTNMVDGVAYTYVTFYITKHDSVLVVDYLNNEFGAVLSEARTAFTKMAALASFKYCPIMFNILRTFSEDAISTERWPIVEWDEAIIIDEDQLERMNVTIALHLFGGN